MLSESTRDALRFYATHKNKPEWNGNADFISLLLKLWNVMNVKSWEKGKHKRSLEMDPVRSSLDWKLRLSQRVYGVPAKRGEFKTARTHSSDVLRSSSHMPCTC